MNFTKIRRSPNALISVYVVTVFVSLTLLWANSIAAQDQCENCAETCQSPVAKPGGPYVTITGQSVELNGWDSWCQYGYITDYEWDFGDGTWGSGPVASHQ